MSSKKQKEKINFVIKSLVVLLYTVIKVYILIMIVGGIVLYYLSPQFKELVVQDIVFGEIDR